MIHTKQINIKNEIVTEIVSNHIIIRNSQDALDIMASYSTGYLILHEYNFEKDFFDLRTGIAGEILQKFTNYHVRLAIIGDFAKFKSKSLQAFIYESNKHCEYIFVNSVDEALNMWSKQIEQM
jgi:hypothetical protein